MEKHRKTPGFHLQRHQIRRFRLKKLKTYMKPRLISHGICMFVGIPLIYKPIIIKLTHLSMVFDVHTY